jgi:DNA-binding CsgD family transcriptional regulator
MPLARGVGFLGRTSERRLIDEALDHARRGQSAALVIRGEPGVGKTALLRYAARQASGLRVAHVEGIQAEIELPFSGIHRLCAPFLAELDGLPEPQRNALHVAFGLASGETPDKFLVALAVLNLLATSAAERPLLCVVDDAQWLDATSLGALGFVARRVVADAMAMVFALREPATTGALERLPQVVLEGLDEPDARALLALAVAGPLEERVRDRIIGETRGNPLALLELSRRMSPGERAGGFAPAASGDVHDLLAQEYRRRVASLPEPTQLLVLLAAAEPLGDAALLWRAAAHLSIEPDALASATKAGLLEVDDRVRFHHPLVRSAVYAAASPDQRRRAHQALAAASDPEGAADSRAWHRALATAEPDEAVAHELERAAARAQDRGGLSAAAALLERATMLTPDPAHQAARALAAAEVCFRAGDFHATERLLATAQGGALDDFQRARAALVRGHAAAVSRSGNDVAALLLEAARQLEPFDLSLARRAYLTAWTAAVIAHHLGGAQALVEISKAVRNLPPLPSDPDPLDLAIDGFARLVTEGHATAMPILRRAGHEVLNLPVEDVLRWGWQLGGVRSAIWDDDAIAVYERQAQLVRGAGALAELPVHLQALALERAWRGDLAGARRLVTEADSIASSIGNKVPPFALLRVLALEGREEEASPLIDEVIVSGASQGQGIAVMVAHWASAVLNNGLGRFERAKADAAEVVSKGILPWLSMWASCELIEAAARSGDADLAHAALNGLLQTTQPASSHLARGIETRSLALLADDSADELYLEALTHLAQSGNRTEVARAELLYGEWLSVQGSLREARVRLRTAEGMFVDIGMQAFAARAQRGLVVAGAKPRMRPDNLVPADLTSQEGQIIGLARDGLTNAQIGAQLFLSPRTVEWHLHKAFGKLGIDSREKLADVLTDDGRVRLSQEG